MGKEILSLEASIQQLKSGLPSIASITSSAYSPKQAAHVYFAAISFLCHLKKDQATLQRARKEASTSVATSSTTQESTSIVPCPQPDEIPAMTAVLQDAVLFRVWVACLQPTAASGAGTGVGWLHHDSGEDVPRSLTTTGPKHHQASHSLIPPPQSSLAANNSNNNSAATGRKRSYSVSSDTNNSSERPNFVSKAAKVAHFHHLGNNHHHHHHHQQQHQPSPLPTPRLAKTVQNSATPKPLINVKVLAATVLQVALQHVDHWPAILVKAYAEDCFGTRSWVDDERCRLLVQNLSLTHLPTMPPSELTTTTTLPKPEKEVLEVAEAVAQAYRRLGTTWDALLGDAIPSNDSPSPTIMRRPSLASSTMSGGGGPPPPPLTLRPSRSASVGSSVDQDSTGAAPRDVGRSNSASSVMGEDDNDDEVCILDTEAASDLKGDNDDEDDGSSSSSSGEESEHVAITTPREPGPGVAPVTNRGSLATKDKVPAVLSTLHPLPTLNLNLVRIRQRYFGVNLDDARDFIASALSDRLDQKAKQNSGLLQSLPSFTTIPTVRKYIAENLEKWLQSPALAGLARSLFASTVRDMKNEEPPLEEDLRAIDCILAMRLKANQLNAHIENITLIAKKIPTEMVALRMFSTLLQVVLQIDEVQIHGLGEMKMVSAIHKALSPEISCDAFAKALLMTLAKSQFERGPLVKKLRRIIRTIAIDLGPSFDGRKLVHALLSFDVTAASWSTADEEDRGRLIFQALTMSVHHLVSRLGGKQLRAIVDPTTRSALLSCKCLVLKWCCTDYGPRYGDKVKRQRALKRDRLETELSASAAQEEFSSALSADDVEKIPAWLNTMRCMLFLEDADSESQLMKCFLYPAALNSDDDQDWDEERARIRLCNDACGDLNDEMLHVVIKSADPSSLRLEPSMAVQLLEHLFEGCSKGRGGTLRATNPVLVWEMYSLVQYSPARTVHAKQKQAVGDDPSPESQEDDTSPKLAYPGLWWRVTMMALAMCASDPSRIGLVVWQDHPTLKALMKMVTSNRYRFPTVDCDEHSSDEMDRKEQQARDEELRLAELLFLPPTHERKADHKKVGSRVSKRLLKQQHDREAAKELEEKSRRKKLLRVALKSIMLWDPDGPARKPPREAVRLLLSVEKLFDLSNKFQRSVDPDFLLMTIGQTTRGSIERAYDWLIPIISKLPETISRLPSSASCFLLLRAYGTGGDERVQLKKLAAPLLGHVKESLRGAYGEADSVMSLDLLMSDVASRLPEKRRCSRRVLHDALIRKAESGSNSSAKHWMFAILEVEYAAKLVSVAIKHMWTAAALERGRTLRSIVFALEKYISFAEGKGNYGGAPFNKTLLEHISNRPTAYAEALNAFTDLMALAVKAAHAEFSRYSGLQVRDPECKVVMYQCPSDTQRAIWVSGTLLKSTCVILSIWSDVQSHDTSTISCVEFLLEALFGAGDVKCDGEPRNIPGLAGAHIEDDGSFAIPVESWIMLAKARSDLIRKRAALAAPAQVLARLLLCSGLPGTSFLTIIDRLSQLGESSENKEQLYHNLLLFASSTWDTGRAGNRRDIAAKMLSRLDAYLKLNADSVRNERSGLSTTFISWLSEHNASGADKPKKPKPRKGKDQEKGFFSSIALASTFLSSLSSQTLLGKGELIETNQSLDSLVATDARLVGRPSALIVGEDFRAWIASMFKEGRFHELHSWMNTQYQTHSSVSLDVSRHLIQLRRELGEGNEYANSLVLSWVPRLSRFHEDAELWKLLFLHDSSSPVESALFWRCVRTWSVDQIRACKTWVCEHLVEGNSALSAERFAAFLVFTSEESSVRVERFSDNVAFNVDNRDETERMAAAALNAFKHGRRDFSTGISPGEELLLLLASRGARELNNVVEIVMKELLTAQLPAYGEAIMASLLRIYAKSPNLIDLGSSSVRAALMDASNMHATSWTYWPCSLDDSMEDMLESLELGDLRMVRPLSEICRKHPLLFLRKVSRLEGILYRDASNAMGYDREAKGVVHGENLSGAAEARWGSRIVKVIVRHWGYSYSEPLWMAVLEIISAAPSEVLFQCGVPLNLVRLFQVYLQLMSVQLQLLSAAKSARLKAKLTDLFTAFQAKDKGAWTEWLGTRIEASEVRHVLLSCDFLTPEQAIASFKGGA